MHLFTPALALIIPINAIWPLPRQIQTGHSVLKLSNDFHIEFEGFAPPPDLLDAAERSKQHILNSSIARLIVGRGETDRAALSGETATLDTLVLSLTGPAHSIAGEVTKRIEKRKEGYTLVIHECGAAFLEASSTLGLFRGLPTFEQLWYTLRDEVYTVQAPIEIMDVPAFPYRRLMLDTARNFYPLADIKRTLDAMSWVKLNTFHCHVVDSQSFPLEVPGFTEIAANGAYSADEIYSIEDTQEIIAYAASRGIDVIIELDTPGHTAILAESHPDHVACAYKLPWNDYAAEPPSGQLRIASAATVDFTTRLLSSLARSISSKYISTGGDEVNVKCYEEDEQTQADLKKSGKTEEQALDAFTQSVHGALGREGKTPVVWEEMALEHKIKLSNETIVMVWISSENAARATAKGFRIVQVPSDYFYLDCGAGEMLAGNPTGNSWCDPFKTWQKSYTFDPLANLPTSQHHLVLGGQHALWSEQSSPENLDSIVWPRAASAAEVFWTGANRGNTSTALPRLHEMRYRMVKRGVGAIALQPHWCALRAGACDASA